MRISEMKRMTGLWCVLMVLVAVSAQGQIPSSFFGMGIVTTLDLPKVTYGTMSHPPLVWTTVESGGRGVYNWKNLDPFVNNAPRDANGTANIVLSMGWTPGWAVASHTHCFNTNHSGLACTVPPDNMQDWVDFLTTLVAHYNGKSVPHVKFYEIWNEANDPLFWTGTMPQLVSMAQVGYPILKSDPFSNVTTPSVIWSQGISFLTAYLKAGGADYADALTFHGYPSATGSKSQVPVPMPESSASTNAPIQTMIADFRQVADQNGMLGKPMGSTEGGWGVHGVSDQDMQMAWIAHYEVVQAGLAASDNLIFQTWYTWGQGNSGTIETTTGTPTKAGNAYDVVLTWLTGQTAQPCTTSGNIWSCAVASNLIVWDASQSCSAGVCTTSSYTAPAGYTKYVDLTAKATTIKGVIALGIKPIMLEP
jgi:polysaccharide biosynthesis protein PslG